MTPPHPCLSTRDTYPDDKHHALIEVVRAAGGVGITIDELDASMWFGPRDELEDIVTTFTTHNLLDTIEIDVSGEERLLVIPGSELSALKATDLEFAVNVLFA